MLSSLCHKYLAEGRKKMAQKKGDFTKTAKAIRIDAESHEKLRKRAEKNGTTIAQELAKLLKRTLRNE